MASGPMDLRGRVVIVDAGATSTLRRIGGALSAIGAQSGAANRGLTGTVTGLRDSARTMRAVRTVGGGHSTYAGLGATGGALGFLKTEYEYQKAMNRTQAVLNVTDDAAFKPHRDLVVDLAKRYPATSAEIAKGASELAMAGLTMEQVNGVLEATVQGALATGESIQTIGMGVTDVALGLGLKLTAENFEYLNNVMAAANTSYSQNYMGFLSGFYKTAPIARMVGMDVRRLAGFLGILADAGFKAEKGGTALRTSIINAAAPTPKAMAQLEKYGISLDRFKQRADTFQLGGAEGAKTLADMIATELGIDGAGLDLDQVLTPLLSDPAAFGDPGALKRQLVSGIVGSLGMQPGEDTKALAETVHRFVESGFQQIDFEGLLRHMAEKGVDKDLVFMDAVFKKRFAAAMGAIMNSMRDGSIDFKLEEVFLPRIEGAVHRFADILMKGLPGSVQRLFGAFDGLLREMGKDGGAIDTITWGIDKLRDGLNWLSTLNPAVLEGLTLGLVGLGVLAPIGFALAGVAAGLTVLVALAGGILRFTGALWAMRKALSAVRGLIVGGGAVAAGAGAASGLFGVGAGAVAGGLTAKAASKALGRMGSATASSRMIGGMSAAGTAAAGAGAAGSAGLLGRLGRLGGRALLPLGLALLGYDAWQGYQKDGWKGAVLNPLTLGMYSGGDAEASEGGGIDLPAIDVDQGMGLDGSAVADAQSIADQIQQAFASIDLHAAGQQMMASLAAGITAGGAQAVAAANNVASQVRAAGQRVQLNTGPNMMPAR